MSDIRDKNLVEALVVYKDAYNIIRHNNLGSWVSRQALLTILYIDARGAKANGVSQDMLDLFDKQVLKECEAMKLE